MKTCEHGVKEIDGDITIDQSIDGYHHVMKARNAVDLIMKFCTHACGNPQAHSCENVQRITKNTSGNVKHFNQ